jgi:hypothetical protein
MIEAVNFYQQPYNLIQGRRAAFLSGGRLVTASIKFLDIKIAELVKEANDSARAKGLEQDFARELSEIRRKYDNPQDVSEAIKNWAEKHGLIQYLWTHLYNDIMPSAIRKLVNGFQGQPPMSQPDAEDMVNDALASYLDLDADNSVIKALMNFDASKGQLMTWLEGGFLNEAKRHSNYLLKQRGKETSMNASIEDDETEFGDLFSDKADEYDIESYVEKAQAYNKPYQQILEKLKNDIKSAPEGAEKLQAQTELRRITDSQNGFKKHLDDLLQLGEILDDVAGQLRDVKKNKQQAIRNLSYPGLNQEERDEYKEEAIQYSEKERELSQNLALGSQKFNEIITEIENLEAVYSEEGTPLVETPEGEVQAPAVVKKPRGNRKLINPEDLALLQQDMEQSREEIMPAFYRSLYFRGDEKRLNPWGLFSNKQLTEHIKTPEEYQALLQRQLEGASPQAKAQDIINRGLLYARDMNALAKAYQPTVEMSGTDLLRRSITSFYNFVTREAEATQDERVIAIIHSKLTEFLTNNDPNQAPMSKFRELFENFDYMARGAAYENARSGMFDDKDWDDLNDEERAQIAQNAYENQYPFGFRPMYVGRWRDKSSEKNKFEPRYPMGPDKDNRYQQIMQRELWRIGRQRAREKRRNDIFPDDVWRSQYSDPRILADKWYEILFDDDESTNFKNQQRTTRKNTGVPSTNVNPANGGDDVLAQVAMQLMVKLAESYDKIGDYRSADNIMSSMQRMAEKYHGSIQS